METPADHPPPQPERTPWTGLEVLAGLFLVFFVQVQVGQLLRATGFYNWLYGPEQVAEALRSDAGTDGAALRTRMGLWVKAAALPLQVALLLAVVYRLSGTRPSQLGLRWSRASLRGGLLLWAGLTPLVYLINYLVTLLFRALTPGAVSEHSFVGLVKEGLLPAEVALLVVSAIVVAPLMEELLFRGLCQRWFAKNRQGSHLAVCAALALALTPVLAGTVRWYEATDEGAWQFQPGPLLPFLFVLALLPAYLIVCRRSATSRGPALFAASLVFAMIHPAWPTPIALFVLALGLGWLADRYDSLVGPIVAHGLFNAVGCVQLFWPAS